MRQALESHRDIGAEVLVPAFLGLIAEVHGKLRQPAEGLSAVTEALAVGDRSGQHYWEAELYRLRGMLTLQAGTSSVVAREAESCFLEAIEIARKQRARSLELRAATSLSRLWGSQGKVTEAHALLSDIYHWFTEGFDAADLSEAKSLLEELGSRLGGSSPEVSDTLHAGPPQVPRESPNGRARRGPRLGDPRKSPGLPHPRRP